MKVNIKKDNTMEMENIQKLMEIIMKEIGSKESNMEKENIFIKMEKCQKVIGNKAFFKINLAKKYKS